MRRRRPESHPYLDLERRSLHIAPRSIVPSMLVSGAKPIWIYDSTCYDEHVYGERTWIYDYTCYDEHVYG